MTRCLLSLMIVFAALSVSAKGKVPAEKDMAGYLFAYFTGNNNNKEEDPAFGDCQVFFLREGIETQP